MSGRWGRRLRCALAATALLLLAAACGDDVHTASEKLRADDSPLVRAGAAERLGEIGDDEAIRALTLHGLRDASPMVRTAAARALSGKSHPQVIDLLGERLLDPDAAVQEAAAQALAANRGDKARRYLELAYARTGSAGRVIIGQALVDAGASPRRTVEEIAARRLQRNLEAVEVGSQAERVGATQELGRSGQPEAVTALISQLGHPVVAIAASAATALADAGDPRAIAPLIEALSEPYPALRRAVVLALGRLGDPEAAEALGQVASRDGKSEAMAAVTALGRLATGGEDGKKVGEVLCEVARSADDAAVAAAAAALLRNVPDTACDLSDRVERGLGREGSERAIALALLAEGGADWVDDTGRDRLRQLVSHDDLVVRAAAWQAAARVGLEGADDEVIEALTTLTRRDQRARERWIDEPLPGSFGWGEAEDHAHGDPGQHLEQLGLSGRQRYRSRYGELMERVAEYRAERETMRRAAQGLEGDEDASARHLQALLTDSPTSRVTLLGGIPSQQTQLLGVMARTASALAGAAAIDTLTALLAHPETEVRLAAVAGLGSLEDARVVPILIDALDEHQPGEVVAAMAGVLSARGAGRERLIEAARWADPEGLRGVVAALGVLGGGEAAMALEPLLDGPAAAEAAVALATMGGESAFAVLIPHLAASDAPGTAEVLGIVTPRTTATEMVAVARRALHSERGEVRAAAAGWLRRAGVNDPWLEALRSDYDGRVRRAAGP